MPTEIELKYQLSGNSEDNNAVADDITVMLKEHNVSFETNQSQLINDYFDNENLALRKMDFGLRIRTKGQQYEQTIKTAGKVVGCLHQRPEFNINIETNKLKLSLFDKTIWPENTDVDALENSLKVIFSTNFLRKTWLIHQDKSVIELALDKGEIFTLSGEPTRVINELEIELVSGNEQALFTLAEQLMTVVTMEPGKLSKAARGYALYHDQKK
jgi:triphosphatase